MADNRDLDTTTDSSVVRLDEGLIRERLQNARDKAERLVRETERANTRRALSSDLDYFCGYVEDTCNLLSLRAILISTSAAYPDKIIE